MDTSEIASDAKPETVVVPMSKPLLQRLVPYLLIAPTLILVFTFTIWPVTQTIQASMHEPGRATRDDAGRRVPGEPTFVGVDNYTALFDSTHFLGRRFPRVLTNTIFFTTATVVVGLPLALGFALLINRPMRGLGLWRFGFFYTVLLPLIGAANIWAFMFANTTGVINTVLGAFGISGQDWLGNPQLVIFSLVLVNIWKQTGFFMIFYLAALQNTPRDIYEAAELDGGGYFTTLYYLTLPLLRRTSLFLVIVSSTYAFQTVEQLEALNRGQPADRGNLLLYFIFQNLGSSSNMGYVNAMTVILIGLLLVFTVSNFIVFEGRSEDE
ncbi:MAG: sugar ABC transporter permease [Anaerolineaceae bacterium]|nr:MAG: sugar ABC transporter permease [Anaerolineaceae bacterium]